MELLWKVLILALTALTLSRLVEKHAPELSLLPVLAALLCALVPLCAAAGELLSLAEELLALVRLSPTLFSPLLKTLGIALTVRFGSAYCRDASHESLSVLLETAGTLCALLAALPLVRALIGVLEGFL